MSNIQTGAERMPHDLSHLGFLAGQIGRLITISTTPVIAGDSFEMDAVGALRLSPLRRIDIQITLKQMLRDFIGIRVNRAKKSGMVNITSSVNSRERSGINTILHELNPLF